MESRPISPIGSQSWHLHLPRGFALMGGLSYQSLSCSLVDMKGGDHSYFPILGDGDGGASLTLWLRHWQRRSSHSLIMGGRRSSSQSVRLN